MLKIDGINFYINKKITKSKIIKNISFKHKNKIIVLKKEFNYYQ